MYLRKDYGPVVEVIASWENRPDFFLEETIQPDGGLDHLLDSPRRAFQQIFGGCRRGWAISEADWKNHVFSQKCVVAEICAWASRDRGYLDILREI